MWSPSPPFLEGELALFAPWKPPKMFQNTGVYRHFCPSVVSTVAPPDPKWLKICQKKLVIFFCCGCLSKEELALSPMFSAFYIVCSGLSPAFPSEILVSLQSVQASVRYVSFLASIWLHPMHKHLENLRVPWSRLGTDPPQSLRWLCLVCEVGSKVKCVLNVRQFGDGIGVTKVAVRKGAPRV